MQKCKNCGEQIKKRDEICPQCGYNPSVETITELPPAKIRQGKIRGAEDVPKKDRNVVCVNCRTNVPGNLNICPKCGLNPTAQTITDLPPWKER